MSEPIPAFPADRPAGQGGGSSLPPQQKLRKELGLSDVYAIRTEAMFSSGFFLLPGLAVAQAGPSVALAYPVAAIAKLASAFQLLLSSLLNLAVLIMRESRMEGYDPGSRG